MSPYIAKSKRIAESLAGDIHSGKLSPGTKLDSLRNIATRFNVSQKVIMGAMDILDSKRLIDRFPRSGIIVKPRPENAMIEAVILLPSNQDAYVSRMLEILAPENRENGVDFICRTVDYPKCGADAFSFELGRIADVFHPDCVIIFGAWFGDTELQLCRECRIPVLFIGDFMKPEMIHAPYLQLTGDNYRIGESAVEQIATTAENGKICCLCGCSDYYFYRETIRGFSETVRRMNLKCFIYEVPHGFSEMLASEQKQIIDNFLKKSIHDGFSDCPVVDLGNYAETFYRFGRGMSERLFVMEEMLESKRSFLRQTYAMIRYAAEHGSVARSVVTSGIYKLKSYKAGNN